MTENVDNLPKMSKNYLKCQKILKISNPFDPSSQLPAGVWCKNHSTEIGDGLVAIFAQEIGDNFV
jgi:hypothetical protein